MVSLPLGSIGACTLDRDRTLGAIRARRRGRCLGTSGVAFSTRGRDLGSQEHYQRPGYDDLPAEDFHVDPVAAKVSVNADAPEPVTGT